MFHQREPHERRHRGMRGWAEGHVIQNCCPRGGSGGGMQRLPVTENRWRAEHSGVKRSGLGLEPSLWPRGREGLEGAREETGGPVKRPVPSRWGTEKTLDPPAAVGRLLGQASLGDQRQRSAKGNLVRGRRGTSRGRRQPALGMRSGSRRHGDPLVCGSRPLLPRRSCGSSREPAVSPTARHLCSVSAGRQLGGLCRIQHRSSFQGKKKKNLPEQQASGSQRINNGPSSSETQMEREGGRSPREAPTSPEFGPTKATSWGDRAGHRADS